MHDINGWASANPNNPFSENELYKPESGMGFAAAISQAPGDYARLKRFSADFGKRWISTINYCRKEPQILQRDAIFRCNA